MSKNAFLAKYTNTVLSILSYPCQSLIYIYMLLCKCVFVYQCEISAYMAVLSEPFALALASNHSASSVYVCVRRVSMLFVNKTWRILH